MAISLLKSEEVNSIAYGYIIFGKIEERLRKISATINSSDIELEDISAIVSL